MSSHTNFVCTYVGVMVNPLFPDLGASPYGFACCDCCGKGLVEIEFPFTARDIHPSGLRGKPRSCFLHLMLIIRKYRASLLSVKDSTVT